MTFCAPAHHHIPPHVGTYGGEVADLADSAGLSLDPEQRLVLDTMYAHDQRGRLVAPEFGCSAPRQNVKTHVAKAAALGDLVLFEEPAALWTAHLRATSDDAFRNAEGTGLADLFENYDHLRRMLDGAPKDSDGEKVIRLRRSGAGKPTPQLSFMARSERGGRGLSGRRVIFDEALFLKPSMLSAMVPILSAQSLAGDVQVRYLGSAGLQQSAVWREIRDRGRAGDARRLAWIEWAAPFVACEQDPCQHRAGTEGCALDRPELVVAANLAIGRRMDLEFVLGTERLAMTPIDYMTERLGWWQDPPNAHGGDLDVERWLQLADADAQPVAPLAWGVDQGEDRLVSISCTWARPDGRTQVMLSQRDETSLDVGLAPAVAVARLVDLTARWGGDVVLGGPAAGLEQDLDDRGVRCITADGSEFATACGRFDDMLRAGELAHGDQQPLNDAVRQALWRSVGTAGERAFKLKDAAGIGPLAAAVRALHGLVIAPSRGGWVVSF